MERLFVREARVVAPGCVHLPGWLEVDARRALVRSCRGWGEATGGYRRPRMPNGSSMSVGMTCLGWHWVPYRYSRTVDDGDGRDVAAFPGELTTLSRRAVADAVELDARVLDSPHGPVGAAHHYAPDVAIVNWYGARSRMGMHADKDERSAAPVVSLSVGDSCIFRFGTPAGRGRPWHDLQLDSGDLVVFGGPSRFAYHGVPRVFAGTGSADTGQGGGRFNVTIRESGLGVSPAGAVSGGTNDPGEEAVRRSTRPENRTR